MTERTRMLSVSPGTRAGSMQAPRTIRSIGRRAARRAPAPAISGSSVSAFILARCAPAAPARGLAHRSICSTSLLVQVNGASHSRWCRLGQLALAGQVHEHRSMSAVSSGSAVRWLMSV
jgi:hypothetical protein